MVSAQRAEQWNGDCALFSVCWQHAFYGKRLNCLCLSSHYFALAVFTLSQSKSEIFHINPSTFPQRGLIWNATENIHLSTGCDLVLRPLFVLELIKHLELHSNGILLNLHFKHMTFAKVVSLWNKMLNWDWIFLSCKAVFPKFLFSSIIWKVFRDLKRFTYTIFHRKYPKIRHDFDVRI